MLKHLTRHNFNTLIKALKSEPLPQIWSNLKGLLSGKSSIRDANSFQYIGPNNDWIVFVDFAYFSQYSSTQVVLGWFVQKQTAKHAQLNIGGQPIHSGYYREDIANNSLAKDYPQSAMQAGFIAVIPKLEANGLDPIELRVTLDQAEVFSRTLQPTAIQSIEHLPWLRNQQYGAYTSLVESLATQTPSTGPKISVILPVYNVSIDYLQPCIQSVINQSYTNWELCICDDASTRPDTIGYLKSIVGSDPRIKIHFSEVNQNISGSSNTALTLATGQFVCLLDHDDVLHAHALSEVAEAISVKPNVDIIYSDEDKLDKNGQRVEPYYKPQFSLDLLLANNYICHLLVIRKSIGDSVGWFTLGLEGAQDHDLILRCIEKTDKIHHIPKVLYHWRKIEGSTALGHSEKSYANKAGLKTIKHYVKRNGINAKVKNGDWIGSYRLQYKVTHTPKIAIVIPFKDQVHYLKKCLSSIYSKTKYPNYEIILVDNNSEQQATLDYLDTCKVIDRLHILKYTEAFNYSKINNFAISQTDAEVVLLLNNDIEVITPNWLTMMYSYLQRESIGAVGAHLLYDDNTNQHNGVVLGIGGVAGHAFKGMPSHQNHYYLDGVPRNVSGCTAACLMVKKAVWAEVNGLNEDKLKVAFNDVDFCLKIRAAGHQIVYLSDVKLYHYESKSRGYEDTPEKIARFKVEEQYMKDTWADILPNDPFYNPNLTLIRQDYGLNMEGAITKYIEQSK